MTHYATLKNYEFDAEVKDVRGTALYGRDEGRLGNIADVVFDHDTGDVDYLVADMGYGRNVLIPTNYVSRSGQNDLTVALTRGDMQRLPMFDSSMLDPNQWESYKELYSDALPVASGCGSIRNAEAVRPTLRLVSRDNVTSIDAGRNGKRLQTQVASAELMTADPVPHGLREFQDNLRSNLDHIRSRCAVCSARRRRIA